MLSSTNFTWSILEYFVPNNVIYKNKLVEASYNESQSHSYSTKQNKLSLQWLTFDNSR